MPEEEVMKLAQDHMDLTSNTGIKRKKNKGKGETTPTPTQTQKRAVEGSMAIKLWNTALGRPSTTPSDKSLRINRKTLDDTRIEGNAEETERQN